MSTRFHFSLNVSDLARSVAFYEKLFGESPSKNHEDYAKFEIDDPPLVFSLAPISPASDGSLSYLGFPCSSIDEVEATARRLDFVGIGISEDASAAVGQAPCGRFRVYDPDHNEWEIYVVDEIVGRSQARGASDGFSPRRERLVNSAIDAAASLVYTNGPCIWEHRVTDDMPGRIPYDDGTVDEVRLTGTFNSHVADRDRPRLLSEALRVLKDGGQVKVHGLVSSRPLDGRLPDLPGVAALVKRVPTEAEPLMELQAAGFVDLHVTKLSESAVFSHGLAEMREIKITGSKPFAAWTLGSAEQFVIYNGPFAEVVDDAGRVYRRGERSAVTAHERQSLASSAAGKQFSLIGNR